jgi:phage terminase small subunit
MTDGIDDTPEPKAKKPAKGSRPIRAKRHLAVVAGTDTTQAKPTSGGSVGTSKGDASTGTRRKSGKNLLLGLTSKQEAFAEAVVSGMSLSAAYKHAYDAEGMQDESVRVAASRLFSQANVSLRVQALNAEKEEQRRMLMVSDAEASINTLREMLKSADTSSAKIRAAELLGKAAGIFTDRIEVNDTTDRSTADIERSIADRLARLGIAG